MLLDNECVVKECMRSVREDPKLLTAIKPRRRGDKGCSVLRGIWKTKAWVTAGNLDMDNRTRDQSGIPGTRVA